MSVTRKAVIAAVAALDLGGSMVASTVPADANSYAKEGSVSAKEANKLFKQAFKQKCLTVHEAQHIAHGNGQVHWESEGDAWRASTFPEPGRATSTPSGSGSGTGVSPAWRGISVR